MRPSLRTLRGKEKSERPSPAIFRPPKDCLASTRIARSLNNMQRFFKSMAQSQKVTKD